MNEPTNPEIREHYEWAKAHGWVNWHEGRDPTTLIGILRKRLEEKENDFECAVANAEGWQAATEDSEARADRNAKVNADLVERIEAIEQQSSISSDNGAPSEGFLRLPQIIGDKKKGIPALIPVSRATWWNGVRSGIYPKSVNLAKRTTAWKVQDIRDLIESLEKGDGGLW